MNKPKLPVQNVTSSYDACGIIEGFTEENPTLEQSMNAWAYLIETGTCWHLQGFYGRGAQNLIDNRIISKDGVVNWDRVYSL